MEKIKGSKSSVVLDPRLSLKALGLYVYVANKPKGWRFSTFRIAQEKNEGRDSIRTAIAQLELLGYLSRVRDVNEKGQFLGWLFLLSEPSSDFPAPGKPAPENPTLIHNKIYGHKGFLKKENKTATAERTIENRAKFARFAEETNTEKEKQEKLAKAKKKAREWILSHGIEYDKMISNLERKFRNEKPEWNPRTVSQTAKAAALNEICKKYLTQS